MGYHLAPLGLDAVVTRGRVDVGPALLKRVSMAAACRHRRKLRSRSLLYGLSAATAVLLLAGTAAGGLMLVAAARFQSQQRFTLSMAFIMSPNLLLLLGALATIAMESRTATLPFAILTLGLALAAALGWVLVLTRAPSVECRRFPQYRGTKRWRSRA